MKNELKHLYSQGIWCIFAISTFFILGCGQDQKEPLRIASSPWPGYEPLYLARDLGYLSEEKVSLFELPSSDITMESFRNKSTDLATLTLDETLELLHDGTRLHILLIMDISHGGDAVMAGPDIKSLADIKGKRISIVNIPLGLYMLNRLLDKAGLERSDVTVFPMSEAKQEKFYADGKADIVITFEPVKTKLLKRGAHVIFDSSMIPNEIFDLLLVHEEVFQDRKKEICEISNAWFKSLDYIRDNKSDAANRITKRLGVNANDFDALMDGIIFPNQDDTQSLLGGSTPDLLQPAKRLSSIMVREKQLSRNVDISNSIDGSFTSCYTK